MHKERHICNDASLLACVAVLLLRRQCVANALSLRSGTLTLPLWLVRGAALGQQGFLSVSARRSRMW